MTLVTPRNNLMQKKYKNQSMTNIIKCYNNFIHNCIYTWNHNLLSFLCGISTQVQSLMGLFKSLKPILAGKIPSP